MRNQPRQVLRATTISPDSHLLRCISKDDAVTGKQFELTRPRGPMDKALVFGTKDCRFESCQGQVSTFHGRLS